jgi:hypothetical protein
MRDAPIATSAVETQPRRPIYPHSAIRGGVYSGAELKTALASDKVAALR